MDCDPLGWFLTADWPPFDPHFRKVVPALLAAMASANTVKGGSFSITLTAATLGCVVSHLADVLVVRAAPVLVRAERSPRPWHDGPP
jgi:hypothetical protein